MSLVEMSISGAVLIFVTVVVRAAAGNLLPKKTFLILWGIVLIHLLVPVRIPSRFSFYGWMPPYTGVADDSGKKHSQMQETGAAKQVSNETEARTAFQNDAHKDTDREKYLQLSERQSSSRLFTSTFYIPGIGVLQLNGQSMHVLEILWAVGCVLCLAAYLTVYVLCRMRFSTSVRVENDFVSQWTREHGGRRQIWVRQSSMVKAPLTYGLFRPVILMPENTNWENTKQMSYIFTHEWVHISRFDIVTKFVLAAALAVHWFNPFVWMMYLLANRDLELSCDETVIRIFGEHAKAEYANMLINMEERKRKLAPLCSGFSKNVIEERILAIMKTKKLSRTAVIAAAALVCAITAIFATSAEASGEPETAGSSTKNSQTIFGQNSETSNRETINSETANKETANKETANKKNAGTNSEAADGEAIGTNSRKFSNISLNLDDNQAEYLYDAVTAHMEKEYEGVYSLRNFQVTFSNEVVCEDILSLDVEVSADMMLIRNPKDSPYMKGMREAIEEITDAGRKKEAEKIYQDYLSEVMPYYRQPEETGFMYQVHVRLADVQAGKRECGCEIFYRDESAGVWELCNVRAEDHFTDTLKTKDGREYIMEMLQEQNG